LLILIWPVEFIVLAASNEKQRLGDQVAKTVVLKNPNVAKKLPRVLAFIAVGFGFFMFIFVFAGIALKNSDAYKVALQNIEKDKEIISGTGGITGYGMMPTGSINTSNDQGQAQLEIKVLRKNKNINVSAYLKKEPNGQWKLIEMDK